jgi:hypothetical protein
LSYINRVALERTQQQQNNKHSESVLTTSIASETNASISLSTADAAWLSCNGLVAAESVVEFVVVDASVAAASVADDDEDDGFAFDFASSLSFFALNVSIRLILQQRAIDKTKEETKMLLTTIDQAGCTKCHNQPFE